MVVGLVVNAMLFWKRKGEMRLVPFKSEAQRKYLFAEHPDIANAWAHGKSSVTGKKESPSQQGKRKSPRKSKRGSRRK